MPSLENLFSVSPELPNVQTHKMPDNSDKWAEVLTTYLREQYPDVAKAPLTVEFRKKDEHSGTAIGAIHVTSLEAEKSVFVPFVIRKFELAPLDVWMEGKSQAVHPLTKDTFKEVFFVQNTAEGLDARPADSSGTYFNDPSLWTTNYPPLQGRYSYASAGYTLLDQLSDSFEAEDGEAFKASLKENPHLIAKFKKHGHAEIIEKLAKKSYVNSYDYVTSAMKLIPTAVVNVKKDDFDKYSLISSVDGLFDLAQQQRVNKQDVIKFLTKITGSPEDFLNEVDQEGEKMLIVRKPAPGVFLYDQLDASPEAANDFAMYRVKTKSGLQLDGMVIPYIVDFAGKKKNYKLFVSKSHSSFQPSIAGVKLMGVARKDPGKLLVPSNIRIGQTGTFVYVDDGKAIATEPVTIKAVEEYGPITVIDTNGKRFTVRRGFGEYFTKEEREAKLEQPALVKGMKGREPKRTYLDAHGFIEARKDIFIIPEKMIWVPLQALSAVSTTVGDWLMKEAGQKMDLDPLTLRWTGLEFDVTGAGLPKLAMDERELKVLLATAGVEQSKIANVLSKAKSAGKVKVYGADRLKSKDKKVGEVAKVIAKVASVAGSLKANLIKEAAEMPDDDKQTVDVLLSLNFLNANNLSKFVAYKPVFDKVLDYLAELTLASRLGLKAVPEAAAVTAMQKLMEISEGLHKIQASFKRPATKTAAAKVVPLNKSKKYLPKSKIVAAILG